MSRQRSLSDKTSLNAGMAVPSFSPPSVIVHMRKPSVAMGLSMTKAMLAGRGSSSLPASPSPRPFGPWQLAQFFS